MRQNRLALLEWARRSAAGELPGLDWVDTEILHGGRPFTVRRDGDRVLFRHVPVGQYLPPAMVEAAREKQLGGEPTLIECLLLLMARSQWLVEGRRLYFTSMSPEPLLLRDLVEAYGVDVEMHRNDGETLLNAIAYLPTFHPYRGDPQRAGAMLQDVLGRPHDVVLDQAPDRKLDELFTVRQAGWFACRSEARDAPRIRDGFLRHRTGVRPQRNPEDVLVGWVPGDRFPHELLRLLPAWVSVRLHEARSS